MGCVPCSLALLGPVSPLTRWSAQEQMEQQHDEGENEGV